VLLEALDAEELGADRVFEGLQDRTFPLWPSIVTIDWAASSRQ